jgi:hypothetical protein
MNFLLFLLALIGWSVAILAGVAFSVVATALIASESKFFDGLKEQEDLENK